jgi:hypothetical protein
LTPDGVVVGGFGQRGHGPRETWDVTSVAVLGDTAYVADPANARIAVFSLQGDWRAEWPLPEWKTDSWRWAHVVADPGRRRVYASVPAQSEVLVFDADGKR